MGIIAWIVLGLIAGVLAKLIMPGRDPGGIIVTMLIGVAGAIVGGFLFSLFGGGGVTGVNIGSIIVAVVGALVLLFLYRMFVGRRGSTSYCASFASAGGLGPALHHLEPGWLSSRSGPRMLVPLLRH